MWIAALISRRVVRRLRALQGEFAICLPGNHEEMMLRCEDRSIDRQNFLLNGGTQTVASYEGHEDEFEDDRRWMSSLPTSYEDELQIFVHAGIKPGQPLAEQTVATKMWARYEFLRFPGAFPKYVVHGHTPTLLLPRSPEVRENRCDLDTGACFGGPLGGVLQRRRSQTVSYDQRHMIGRWRRRLVLARICSNNNGRLAASDGPNI